MSASLPLATPRSRQLVRDLAALLGDGGASCEPADLWAASHDAWPRALLWTKAGLAPHPPDAVAWPRSTQEVQSVVRFAGERSIPVVPYGGGSGVTGAAIPVRGGISLGLKRLVAPPRLDLAARTVDVAAGVGAKRLEELLAAQGATLGHFPEGMEGATLGGLLATRSAGLRAGRYGTLADMVLELSAVDGTGALVASVDGPSFGPNLAQLLLGSEGTFAVITRAKLRCFPAPTAVWPRAFSFGSEVSGARALREILRSGLTPAMLRLHGPLDALLAGRAGGRASTLPASLRSLLGAGQREAMRVALRAPSLLNQLVLALPKTTLLLLAFEGDGPHGGADATGDGEEALRLCTALGGEDLGPAPAERFLAAPYAQAFARAPLFAAGAFADVLDVAVSWDRLHVLFSNVRRALHARAFVTAQITHAYLDGCAVEFSFAGLAGLSAEDARSAPRDEVEEDLAEAEERFDACWSAALSAAADAGATLSHHRGVGLARQLALPREHGEGMRQLRALKAAFDPLGILNPGKLLL